MIWECCQCNQPVDQPCCHLETAKLKKGISPTWCPLTQSHIAGWKKARSKNWLNGGTEAKHGAGQPQQPQAGVTQMPRFEDLRKAIIAEGLSSDTGFDMNHFSTGVKAAYHCIARHFGLR
jgi:hypothetical protein